MTRQLATWVLAAVLAGLPILAVAGWYLRDYIVTNIAMKEDVRALKEDVLVAGGKADFVVDRQMEATINEISWLERKGNLTNVELSRLAYLR